MKGNTIANLAIAGLLTGAVATGAACKSTPDETAEPVATETTGADEAAEATPTSAPTEPAAAAAEGEAHACAGKNSCKGLGGCAVTAEKLTALATAAGVDPAAAGEAHDCAGKNGCKGLGGCAVDAAKLAKLKAAQAPAEGDKPAE